MIDACVLPGCLLPAETRALIDALTGAGYDFMMDSADGALIVLPAPDVPLTATIQELLAPLDEALRCLFAKARDCAGPLRH